ncbi:hypothetical protein ABHI18_000063 [Aspergillus niger]
MTLPINQKSSEGQPWIVSHFAERNVQDHGSAWAALWDAQYNDMWDRGKPSPALIDLVEYRKELFQPLAADGRRKKALVPGCGRGYDVVMLALHGFDAYGVEISATGVAAAQTYASKELQRPQAYNFGEQESDSANPGNVTFLEGDFFKTDWEPNNLKGGGGLFDIIYDYTFLCALHPDMRRQWAARMAGLLRDDGYLVCLEFPLYKDPALLGPPWGLQGVYWDLLVRGGDGVPSSSTTPEVAEADQLGGTDMLSVYARK